MVWTHRVGEAAVRNGHEVIPRPGADLRKERLRRTGWIVGSTLVAGFLGWALVDGGRRVSEYSWRLVPGWLILGLALIVLAYLTTGLGYHGLVSRLQPAPPARLATLSVWARSLLGRYVPGNVLMVLGRLELGRNIGISRRVSLAASIYEQVYGLAMAALWGVAYLVVGFGDGHGRAVWVAALLPALVVVLHPRIFGPMSAWALRRARKSPLETFLSGRQVAAFTAWYALTASLMALGIWSVVHAAAPGAGNPIEIAGAFQLAVALSTLAVIFPSGLGVREGVFALALGRHVPGGVAVALSVGARLILTAVELAFVAVVFLVARRR